MNIERRIERWRDIYKNTDHRTKALFTITYPFIKPEPILCSKNKVQRIDWAKNLYEAQIKNTEEYDDDVIPSLYVMTGTEIFAEAFGCDVVYPEDNKPFALPIIHEAKQVSALKVPKLEDSSLMLLFDMADELQKFAGPDAIFRHVDLQCPMDIAALLWDKEEYFIAMIDEPEAVLETAAKIKELLTAFLDEWYRRYGTRYIAHYPDYYMETGVTMSVDEIGSINPAMFEKFFRDEINYYSDRYHGIGIHCCAYSDAQWENFRNVRDLQLINFVRKRDVIDRAFRYFKDTCVQYHHVCEERNYFRGSPDLSLLPEGTRAVFPVSADSLEDAKRLSEEYSAAFGR